MVLTEEACIVPVELESHMEGGCVTLFLKSLLYHKPEKEMLLQPLYNLKMKRNKGKKNPKAS